MREVRRSALVPFTPDQMYSLVEDLERYPDFVPWVTEARVIERGTDYVIGRLGMKKAGVREVFTTRNTLRPPEEIQMDLVDGPFRVLSGQWIFENVADRGSKVDLRMCFEFSNPMLALLLSRTFEKSYTDLIDSFVARARAVYGRA